MPLKLRLLALLLALLVVAGLGLSARCSSATAASCSAATLFGSAPRLDVPYAGTRPEVVGLMLDMAEVGPGDRVVDLGTGDGRMLLAAAGRGASGLGVDIDAVLVERARAEAKRRGLDGRTRFAVQDLFRTSLAQADVVTMFLLPEVNLRLRPRILSEMRPGARVVSHAFDMGDWTPDARGRAGGARVYLWRVPARVAGRWRVNGSATLDLRQRHQAIGGTLDGSPVAEGRVEGAAIRFKASGRAYAGRVEGDAMLGEGWRAERMR